MLTRRSVLGAAGAGLALAGSGWPRLSESRAAGAPVTPGVPAGIADAATLETLPGKKPLIRLAYRPPNYESPIEYFRTPITPNDEFFVRYHLSDIPRRRCRDLEARGRRRRRQWADRAHARRSEDAAGRRGRRRQPVLGQPARPVQAARAGRRMGLWRDGLRALEGRPAQGRARQGRPQEGSDRDRVQRRRRAGLRQDARLHQEHSGVEGDRGIDADRLRDERRAAAASQRLPGAPHRAGLDRHLLDEAPHLDHGADQAAGRFLDEPGLPHSGRQVPGGGAFRLAGKRHRRRRSPRWSSTR